MEVELKFPGLDINIKDVQNMQLEILYEIHCICTKHNIKYQLCSGTLLGSVRHRGFIPWDDDIDVCMMRKDYQHFLKVCSTDLSPKYFLQTYNTDKEYIMQFAKIKINNTVFLEEILQECNIHHGIFLDIFPFDNVLPDTFADKFQLGMLILLDRINKCRLKSACRLKKDSIIRPTRFVIHYILKAVPRRFTNYIQNKICRMFENKDTRYITHLSNSPRKEKYNSYLMEKRYFHETIEGDFEGYKFLIPKDYDIILRRCYGNYMKLPPVDEQIPMHGIIKIDLGY